MYSNQFAPHSDLKINVEEIQIEHIHLSKKYARPERPRTDEVKHLNHSIEHTLHK